MSMQGKVYIVTGGSRGIGFSIAEALVAAGAKVGIIARSQSDVDTAAQQLGKDAIGFSAAVDNEAAVKPAIQNIHDHFGRLDGLVNNAGIARPGTVQDIPIADVIQTFAINVIGTMNCIQAAVPLLHADNPRIVNISSASVTHDDEMGHLATYAASKAAVERLSQDLRRELQEQEIGVTVVRPGSTPTEFARDFDMDRTMRGFAAWQDRGPYMDTGMATEDVAEAVRWCLALPKGVASDILEIRPNRRMSKMGEPGEGGNGKW